MVVVLAVTAAAVGQLTGIGSSTQPNPAAVQATHENPPKLGVAIERPISAGEHHRYRLPVDGGAARLWLECWKVELTTVVYDVDGRTLAEISCPRGTLRPFRTSAGAHEISIYVSDRSQTSGGYELRRPIVVRRGDEGHALSDAESLFLEAEMLRRRFTSQANHEAISKYGEAVKLWEKAKDYYAMALTLRRTGQAYQALNDYLQATSRYEDALKVAGRVSNARLKSDILNDLAYLHFEVGSNKRAYLMAEQARDLSHGAVYLRGEAQALFTLGEALYGLGDLSATVQHLNQATSLWQQVGDVQGVATAQVAFGYSYVELSDLPKARDSYEQALSNARAGEDRRLEAVVLRGLGNLHTKLGETQKALDFFNQALGILAGVEDRHLRANVLGGLAYAYSLIGEREKALTYYEQALEIYEAISDVWGAAEAQMTIGELYFSMGENVRALEYDEKALAAFRRIKMQRQEAKTLRNIGLVYESLGNLRKALQLYRQSLALFRAGQDQRYEAYTLNYIGGVYRREGDLNQAATYYRQALTLNRLAADPAGESLTLFNLARLERDLGNLEQARSFSEAALRISESLRSKIVSLDLRASYAATARQYFELSIDVLMSLATRNPEFTRQAFEVSEAAHARSLLESLNESQAKIWQDVDPALLAKENSLRQSLDAKAQRRMQLIAERNAAEAEMLSKQIAEESTALDGVKTQLKIASPRYAALTQPQPLTLAQIQQQVLDDDSVLIEYLLGEERSYVWVITRTEISSAELPSRAKIETAIRRFREVLTVNQPVLNENLQQYEARIREAQAQFPSAAAELSDLLITPVQNKLGKKRLIIVPDGALYSIPFQPLTVPSAAGAAASKERIPLMANHVIVYEPSASTLALVLNETRPPAQNTVAVFAHPVFEADDARVKIRTSGELTTISEQQGVVRGVFRDLGLSDGQRVPALPASREEAEAIMSFVPRGTGLKALGFDANRQTVSQPELAQYGIVHFATHGFVDYDHPELSGLVLSLVDQNGQPQPGFLRMHDIYNLKLSANLVVLSACNTGLGKQIKGEGLIGLTRGFMYAGADSVVASLWKVDDDATAALMARFYEGMFVKGLPPEAALREAQLWMSQQERWRAPYFWAAFIIQGRYDQVQNPGFSSPWAQRLVTSAGCVSVLLLMACLVAGRRRRAVV
ncbi:MAG: CHAT domain-containing tetratricopeptide repeat protein [Pyrinomonadaceae bacterium]